MTLYFTLDSKYLPCYLIINPDRAWLIQNKTNITKKTAD